MVGALLKPQKAEAVALLRRAQAAHPGDFWLNFALADALREAGEPGEAEGFYWAALVIRPGTSGIFTNLGNALQDQGKLEEAIACHKKALDPQLAPAHTNLGLVLQAQRKLDEAIACFRQATGIDPQRSLASQ